MKQSLIFASLGLLAATLLSVSLAPHTQATSLLFGQKHAYSAVVRDDKRVVTYGKIFLTNPSDKDIKAASFTLPEGVTTSNLSIYQITLPERCHNEGKQTTEQDTTKKQSTTILPYPPSSTSCAQIEQQAFDFDRYSSYYYRSSDEVDSQLIYKEITPGQSGDTYNFKLPEAITPGKRGAYLVAYMADKGYVSGTLGLYNLAFKTLRVPDSIEEVRVSVDVSKDFYTRTKPSDISRPKSEDLNISDGASAANGSGITSRSLDTLQSGIGSGGVFTKTGKALTSDEEFIVNGEFADAEWKLYLWWIIGGIIGCAAVLALVIFLLKKAAEAETKVIKSKGTHRGK